MNPYKIVNKYYNVIGTFFENMIIGCNGQSYSRLYLDLHSNEIFQNVEASQNTWLHREDGSLAEIAHDNGFGWDLSDEEIDYIEHCGISDFGFDDWIDDYLIPNIYDALENWKGKQCKK